MSVTLINKKYRRVAAFGRLKLFTLLLLSTFRISVLLSLAVVE